MRKKSGIFIVFSLITNLLAAQQSTNSGGGTATGSGGVVTFTTGQSTFTVADGTGGSSSAGVQQAYIVTQSGVPAIADVVAVKLFPNPTSHLLSIETADMQVLRYQLTDALGKKVREGKIKGGKTNLDMAAVAPGKYELILFKQNRKIQSFSILKNSL
jgi:hypothetical protein